MKLSYNPKQLKAAAKHIFVTNPSVRKWGDLHLNGEELTWKHVRDHMFQDLIRKAKENWYYKGASGEWKFMMASTGGYTFLFDNNEDIQIVEILVDPAIGSYKSKEITL